MNPHGSVVSGLPDSLRCAQVGRTFYPSDERCPRDRKGVLAAVASDLGYLADVWSQPIDEQALRRSSNVLRTLLVDNALGRAWRLVGEKGEPTVEAMDLSRHVAGLEWEKIVFASPAGGSTGGGTMVGALQYADAMSESLIQARYAAGPPRPRRFALSEFLASPATHLRRDLGKSP